MLNTKLDTKVGIECYGALPTTPVGIAKRLLGYSRACGSISFSYHISPAIALGNKGLPRSFFTTRKELTRKTSRPEIIRFVKSVHDGIISRGSPDTFLQLLKRNGDATSKTFTEIVDQVHDLGIVDEYIIPVYGPYKIEGCMCYGFDKPVEDIDDYILFELQKISLIAHNKLVKYYQDRIATVSLSKREIEVLHWISLGKSKHDIATISGLKPPTIETYTRRIYSKFGVNSKLGAVLAAIATNNLRL